MILEIILNSLLFLIYIFYMVKLYNNNKNFFVILLPVILNKIRMISSVLYLETGVYIHDFSMTTYFSGSLIRLIIFELIFLFIINKVANASDHDKNSQRVIKIKEISNEQLVSVALILILIAEGLMVLNAIISGNIISNPSVTRFNFFGTYSRLSIATYIEMINPSMMMLCGFSYARVNTFGYKWKKILSVLCLGLFILFKLLIGVQFGGIFTGITYFMIPILIDSNLPGISPMKLNKKVLKTAFLILVSVIILLVPKYNAFKESNEYVGVADSAFEKLIYRAFALEGEVWWKIDTSVYEESLIVEQKQTINEITAFFNDDKKYDSGIWYLMNNILPKDRVYSYSENSTITMNNGHPAILILIFGYFGGILMQILYSYAFAKGLVYFINKIINFQIIRLFLSSMIFYNSVNVLTMGGIWYLGNKLNLVALLCILIIEFIFKRRNIPVFRHSIDKKMDQP